MFNSSPWLSYRPKQRQISCVSGSVPSRCRWFNRTGRFIETIELYRVPEGRVQPTSSEFMGKTFQAAQLTHDWFLTIHHSCKIFFWYLPNWTSTNLWCVVLYVTYSTTHQRSVEVQFGRYQKNILQEWCMVKKLSCVSCGSLKRFPHTFTTLSFSSENSPPTF